MKDVMKKIIIHIKWNLNRIGFFNSWNDEKYLKFNYRLLMGKKLDLNNPKTFNEKMQWLKLNDRNPLYTNLVDKYEVKKYISNVIGEEYIIPTLGVWNSFDEIDFNSLPSKFVLKVTHDSGGVFIVKDKMNIDKNKMEKKISELLKRNYYYLGREWPYKNIKPRIIIEKYMEDKTGEELKDYKFMVFNGKVKCILVCTDRNSDNGLHINFYDSEWKLMPLERKTHPKSSKKIDKPINLDLMIKLAELLAKDIPFIRVDFYEINKKVYFGELTFYPASGTEEFYPEEWDFKLGSMIELPKK